MKITVCELPDGGEAFSTDWIRLAEHVRGEASELILLPDMPFASWFAASRQFDVAVWNAAVRAHDEWEHRLPELGSGYVLSSRPIDFGNERWDEGYVWDAEHGVRSVHAKSQFRNEKGAWETMWCRSSFPEFVPLDLDGNLVVGFLMGAEFCGAEEIRRYGEEHIDVIAVPRGANVMPFDRWRERARELAQLANAYVLASTRSGTFGGQACIVAPNGEVLGTTSATQPFLTMDIQLASKAVCHVPLNTDELVGLTDPLDTGVPPY
ncbi:MAG: nitrilase-related carbon-nitrogen hydrolase [Steroidobacteraceae bacterium]